jgi:hypothetical protein
VETRGRVLLESGRAAEEQLLQLERRQARKRQGT